MGRSGDSKLTFFYLGNTCTYNQKEEVHTPGHMHNHMSLIECQFCCCRATFYLISRCDTFTVVYCIRNVFYLLKLFIENLKCIIISSGFCETSRVFLWQFTTLGFTSSSRSINTQHAQVNSFHNYYRK